MNATIWHNPRCSKSRETLAILREAPGIELTVVEYLKHPPTMAELSRLIGLAGLRPKEALRRSEPAAAALAEAAPTCLLCFERDPALCHRRLLAERLGPRGFTIVDLFG